MTNQIEIRYLAYGTLVISQARPFHFRPTLNIKSSLMLRVVHLRNKKQSNIHGILHT